MKGYEDYYYDELIRLDDIEFYQEIHSQLSEAFQRDYDKFCTLRRKAQEKFNFYQVFSSNEITEYIKSRKVKAIN